MKQCFKMVLLLCAITMLFVLPSIAAEIVVIPNACGINLTYTLSEDGLLTISGSGEMFDFNSSSDTPWYQNRSNIKKIHVEQGVTSIGRCAFSGLSEVTSITLPDSLTNIGHLSFYNCTNITNINIPNVINIEEGAFSGCANLSSVLLPDSLISIGKSAFSNCELLQEIIIPNNVMHIGHSAFSGCYNLHSISLPSSLETIEPNALHCSNLSKITISAENNFFTTIDNVLFNKDCSQLIIYPAGKPDMVYSIPHGVVSIKESAFSGCWRLYAISFPQSLTTIGDYAFVSAKNLKYAIFNGDIPLDWGLNIFGRTASDLTLYFQQHTAGWTSPSWTDVNNRIYATCMFESEEDLNSLILDSGKCNDSISWTHYFNGLLTVSGTGDMPWYWNFQKLWDDHNITNVVLEDGITSIGSMAFTCKNLESITIPNGLVTIGSNAFSNCLFSSIAFPNSLSNIERYAFNKCDNLISVTIPQNVTSLGEHAFTNCENLKTITFEGDAPDNWGTNAIYPNSSDLTIYYYHGASGWTTPTWTAPDGTVYNTVMIGSHTMTHHESTANCKGTGYPEYRYCETCELTFADEAGTQPIELIANAYNADNHVGGTEIRDAKEATEFVPGYTGDTYCFGCNVKLATGTEIPATHEHDFSNATCITPGSCTCGEFSGIDENNHAGPKEYALHTGELTCTACGKVLTYGFALNPIIERAETAIQQTLEQIENTVVSAVTDLIKDLGKYLFNEVSGWVDEHFISRQSVK